MVNSEKLVGAFLGITMSACMVGWCLNLYQFTQLDFQQPYIAEVLRGAGVVIPPIGFFIGYINIED